MTTPPTDLTIVHNPAASRFEAVVDGLTCVAAYHRSGDLIDMHPTPACRERSRAAASPPRWCGPRWTGPPPRG